MTRWNTVFLRSAQDIKYKPWKYQDQRSLTLVWSNFCWLCIIFCTLCCCFRMTEQIPPGVKQLFLIALFSSFMHNVVKWPNILYKSCGVHTATFLKYVCPFYNIMHERVNDTPEKLKLAQLDLLYRWFSWLEKVIIHSRWCYSSTLDNFIIIYGNNGFKRLLHDRNSTEYKFWEDFSIILKTFC